MMEWEDDDMADSPFQPPVALRTFSRELLELLMDRPRLESLAQQFLPDAYSPDIHSLTLTRCTTDDAQTLQEMVTSRNLAMVPALEFHIGGYDPSPLKEEFLGAFAVALPVLMLLDRTDTREVMANERLTIGDWLIELKAVAHSDGDTEMEDLTEGCTPSPILCNLSCTYN